MITVRTGLLNGSFNSLFATARIVVVICFPQGSVRPHPQENRALATILIRKAQMKGELNGKHIQAVLSLVTRLLIVAAVTVSFQW
jgi:hypothetical protein